MDSDHDSSIYEEDSEPKPPARKRKTPKKKVPVLIPADGVDKPKRKKCPAMTPLERALVLELVVKYKDIVESKKSDTLMILKKTATWETIAGEFSASLDTHPRPWKKLRKFWENVKSEAKTEVTKNVKARRKTGGGEAVEDLSAETELISSLIPAQMKSLDNPWDSDGVTVSSKTLEKTASNIPSCGFPEPSGETLDYEIIPSPDEKSKRIPQSTTKSNAEVSDRLKKLEKKNSDPRSYIVDLEHEEHNMRMKLLSKQLETEDVNYKIAVRKLEIMEEEHVKSTAVLDSQLMNLTSTSVLRFE